MITSPRGVARALLLLFIALHSFSCCKAQDSEAVLSVTFKEGTKFEEARWVLRSYGYNFDLREQSAYEVVFSLTRDADLMRTQKEVSALCESMASTCETRPSVVAEASQLTFMVYGKIAHSAAAREAFARSAIKFGTAKWRYAAANGRVIVPDRKSLECARLLVSEPFVERVSVHSSSGDDVQVTSVSESISVSRVDAHSGNERRFPSEVSVSRIRLPEDSELQKVITTFVGVPSRVQVTKSDVSDGDEYFEYKVDQFRGAITQSRSWEQLRFSIPILRVSKDTVKIRCILEGSFASGLGDTPPPDTFFQSMEPVYTRQLQDQVGRFLVLLRDQLSEVAK